MNPIVKIVLGAIVLVQLQANCSKKGSGDKTVPVSAQAWITSGDRSRLLQQQTGPLTFSSGSNNYVFIDVDSSQSFQTVDGFGYSLTGGSAQLINKMEASAKSNLLNELFGNSSSSIKVSYLRISIGASDLNAFPFTYNDMPSGQTDVNLANFSLAHDRAGGTGLIPLLKEILAIRPDLKIMGSPWSPPVWMKDNGSFIGGSLQPQYYSVYAQYFVKYIQQMKAEGIVIDAITPQNEPLHPGNEPSLLMTAGQQTEFIKNHLGPAFKAAQINTKIVIYDHNLDRPDYPLTVLNDPAARQYVDGSAFHLYAGDISTMSQVHNAYPDKHVYFTEQWTGAKTSFSDDLRWHLRNVVIGSMRNWSKIALIWNLASDPFYNPHTPGGCTECKGAITVDGSTVTRNVAYYIIAHASKFVPPGSVRIHSTTTASLPNVAFRTPEGKKVIIVLNDGAGEAFFNIRYQGQWLTTSLPAQSVGTFVW